MSELHEFDDTVVAVIADESETQAVTVELEDAGYDYEVLRGEAGRMHLDPAGQRGVGPAIRRLFEAFGDERRILTHLDEELDRGRTVISVDSQPEEADRAIEILEAHGGSFIWKFGTWTFTPINQ